MVGVNIIAWYRGVYVFWQLHWFSDYLSDDHDSRTEGVLKVLENTFKNTEKTIIDTA
jgi:hypothetical protein